MSYTWVLSLLKANFANMVAHKKSFWSLMLVMCVQNLIYFSLWIVLFSRISSLNGWGLSDVAFLYAVGAVGYGIFFTLFGGLNMLSETVMNGNLDIFLTRPRSLLLSVLLQRMRADSLGDVLCGLILLIFFTPLHLKTLPLILVLTLSTGMVFAAVRLTMHTLAFWGSDGETGENGFMSFLIAGTNPQKGFSPFLKFVMLTVFPAGYVGLLPIEIMRSFRWDYFAFQLLGSTTFFVFSLWFFQQGLRRYTSGNRFQTVR